MSDMLTVKEVAELWNIPDTQVTRYCRFKRIKGAFKENGIWQIPKDAEKPVDRRKKHCESTSSQQVIRRPPPIGVSDYRDACRNYYYVDKTLLIKELLDERPKVSLFTRPRRFGKTLTMDMLKTFFEISSEDTSVYFKDKKIWDCGDFYRRQQGKYPVICLSFKDVKCDSWNETYKYITEIIRLEFIRHSELAQSDKVTLKDRYEKIVSGPAEERDYAFALKYLSQMLREHYGVPPIIIIDEYDTPIQEGHTKDFYEKIVSFMRNLFSGGLKDNDANLSFGFLTGILRVAKESIFSGLNNLRINSVLDDKYSQYFGFTSTEVQDMATYYGVPDKYCEICEWYDGYLFGSTEIFNPWSVINYMGNSFQPGLFWENTSSNAIIGEVLEDADEETFENLNRLLQGEAVTTLIDTSVIYPEIKRNPSSVYSFLLVSGYLKVWEKPVLFSTGFLCKVSLPNREIAAVYRKEIIERLNRVVSQSVAIGIEESFLLYNAEKLHKYLRKFLLESVSCYDTLNENSYHMLLLGLCAIMSDRYYLTSNREAGEGRFDIQLMPKNIAHPGILIEVKAKKDYSEQELEQLAKSALQQIHDKKYEMEMLSKGVGTILKYGVAFSGKNVQIAME